MKLCGSRIAVQQHVKMSDETVAKMIRRDKSCRCVRKVILVVDQAGTDELFNSRCLVVAERRNLQDVDVLQRPIPAALPEDERVKQVAHHSCDVVSLH